jgi:hypothetical protein
VRLLAASAPGLPGVSVQGEISLFTRALTGVWQGNHDQNEDGILSFSEIAGAVSGQVEEAMPGLQSPWSNQTRFQEDTLLFRVGGERE